MCSVDEKGDLYIYQKRVSLVYFRAGYTPQEHNEDTIKGKRKAHLSNAVCVPWIGS